MTGSSNNKYIVHLHVALSLLVLAADKLRTIFKTNSSTQEQLHIMCSSWSFMF